LWLRSSDSVLEKNKKHIAIKPCAYLENFIFKKDIFFGRLSVYSVYAAARISNKKRKGKK